MWSLNHSAPSRDEVRRICRDPARAPRSQARASSRVIQIGDFAVKFGYVLVDEARNQHEASMLLDPAIVGVPKVYDYFVDDGCCFLVMDFVEGCSPDQAEYMDIVPRIAYCLAYIHTFTRPTPGPFVASISRGLLWTDNVTTFTSVGMLEGYLNSRLGNDLETFDLTKCHMVLCHLDIAPRNVLIQEGRLWLLDWETAGFYPRGFEYCALRLNWGHSGKDGVFCEMLERCLASLERPDPQDLAHAHLMQIVAGNSIRYSFTKCRPGKKLHKLDTKAMERENSTSS